MDPGSLPAALRELDPARRALLDLSLRREMDDSTIGDLLGTDGSAVAASREEALQQVGIRVGARGPDELAAVRRGLAELPSEAWVPPSAEGSVGPPAPQAATRPGGGAEAASTSALDDRAPTARPSAGRPRSPTGRVAALDRRRPRRGPIVVAAAVAVAVAALAIALAASGGDDEDQPGDRAGNAPERATPEPEAPRGQRPAPTGAENGSRRPEAEERPGQAGGAGGRSVELEPLADGAGEGTAAVRGGDPPRLSVKVTGLPEPEGRYEVWLFNSLSDAVSLGRFEGPSVDLAAPLRRRPDAYRFLDVSVEPPDGNPNHSGQSVLRAPLDRLTAGG